MSKKLLTLLSVLAVMFAAPLSAQQVPTPEGTVISNQATVSFTDANGSTYAPVVSAAVTVTVGFAGAVDVTGQASYTPASASTGNFAIYKITLGNGISDSVTVSTSAASGLVITGYKINAAATVYNDLTALNAALAATGTAYGDTLTITTIYDVDAGKGGTTLALSLTATSRRDNSKTDTHSTNIMPPVANNAVTVTADVGAISRIPTGTGADYTTSFTILNGSNASRTYALSGSVTGTGTAVTGVNGGTALITIGAGLSSQVNVTYTVAVNADSTIGTVKLTAVDTTDALVTSTGTHTVTAIRPVLTLTKVAYRADGTTPIGVGLVLPGETIVYKLTVTNTGSAVANFGLSVTDPLPAQVTYVSSSGPAGWTVGESAGTVTATLNSPNTIAPAGSAVIVITVTVK